ncbi:MAG: DegT/DnrJ/EryC1/StrS family aminotransferase [Planctomycetaceae bacterium]|nr:DegT/DnrJ/EryC1/StrS family aminotransferase [Planctomycetaceae bacterium]
MHIQLFDPVICEEAIRDVSRVLRSGWLGTGPKTKAFEEQFAAYIGMPYCVGVNSCTAALHLGLQLLNLPADTEVISTPITFVSTNHAILYNRCKPVFADIQPETGNLDIESVRRRITERTGAIMIMHFGGYPCDLDEFYELSGQTGIPIIEDCAHACGASYKGRHIGSHGNIHAFSFHAVKNLPMGDGGALTIRSEEYYQRLGRLRWLGINRDTFKRTSHNSYKWQYDVSEVGYKYQLNDIHAAIGLAQLAQLDANNARRAAIAARYERALSNVPGLKLLKYKNDRVSSRHLFCIQVQHRDDLISKLDENHISTGVHYLRNDHFSMYQKQELPCAEQFWQTVMSLPMHLRLTDEDVDYIADTVRKGW